MFWLGRSLEEVKGDSARLHTSHALVPQGRRCGAWAWPRGRSGGCMRWGAVPHKTPMRRRGGTTKAAELGFRRTALTVIKIRWIPGPQDLEYEPLPDHLRNPRLNHRRTWRISTGLHLRSTPRNLNLAEIRTAGAAGVARRRSGDVRASRACHPHRAKTRDRGDAPAGPSGGLRNLRSERRDLGADGRRRACLNEVCGFTHNRQKCRGSRASPLKWKTAARRALPDGSGNVLEGTEPARRRF
jgi:hypothetical protein